MCCVDSASFSPKRLIPASSSTDLLIRLRKLLISKGKKIKLFSPNLPLTFAINVVVVVYKVEKLRESLL